MVDQQVEKQFELQKLQTLMQLWNNAKKQESVASDQSIELANKTESDLRNLQFTLATFLFTFTTPIFTNIVFNNSNTKILVFLAWIFLLSSILAGFLHMFGTINFFLKQAKFHVKKVRIFSRIGTFDEYQNAVNEANALNSEDIPSSSAIPLVIQSLLLFTGFILIFSAATITLFRL